MDIFRPNGMKVLDEEIERVIKQLASIHPAHTDYETIAKNLQRLTEARERKNDRVISNDVIFATVTNVVVTLLILNFEKTGVITSKAFSFIGRKHI